MTGYGGKGDFVYFPIEFTQRPTVIAQYTDYSGNNYTYTATVTSEQTNFTYIYTNTTSSNTTVSYLAAGK